MHPQNIVGLLSLFTIGAALLGMIVYYRRFLTDPKNLAHAQNVAGNGKGALMKVGEAAEPGELLSMPLKTRLDRSIASQHPVDPGLSMTQAQRLDKFNSEKL